ncbi:MAG: site-2 protease family protein [Hydrogenoanaerobacterium sp.]
MLFGRFNLPQLLVSALMLLTIMPIHEYAHALTAYKLGDGTARFNGRLTLNPLAHLDLWGSIAFLLCGFGWGKPVPVYGSNLRNPKRDMMIVAMAGPASNVLLALVFNALTAVLSAVFGAVGFVNNFAYGVLWVLQTLSMTSVYWAVFNLLPVPPLDGSRLLEYIIPYKYYAKIEYYQRYIYLGMLLLMFTGVLSRPIMFFSGLITKLLNVILLPLTFLLGLLS